MQIKQKEIEKLSKLKQLEYRLEKIEIEEDNIDFITTVCIGFKYFILLIFFALAFFYSNYSRAVQLSESFMKIGLLILILSVIVGFVSGVVRRRQLSKLDDKYFEINKKEEKNGR